MEIEKLKRTIEILQKKNTAFTQENLYLKQYIARHRNLYAFLPWEDLTHMKDAFFTLKKGERCYLCHRYSLQDNFDWFDTQNFLCPVVFKHFQVCPKFQELIGVLMKQDFKIPKNCIDENQNQNQKEPSPEILLCDHKGPLETATKEPKKKIRQVKLKGKKDKEDTKEKKKHATNVAEQATHLSHNYLVLDPQQKFAFYTDRLPGVIEQWQYFNHMIQLLYFLHRATRKIHQVMSRGDKYLFTEKLYLDKSIILKSDEWSLFLIPGEVKQMVDTLHIKFASHVGLMTKGLQQLSKKVSHIHCFCLHDDTTAKVKFVEDTCSYCDSTGDQCLSQTPQRCIHRFRHLIDLTIKVLRRISIIHSKHGVGFWLSFQHLWEYAAELHFSTLLSQLIDFQTLPVCVSEKRCQCSSAACKIFVEERWQMYYRNVGPGNFVQMDLDFSRLWPC